MYIYAVAMKRSFLLLFLFMSLAFGESTEAALKELPNVPLPRQGVYTGKGVSIGIGLGIFNATEECDCLGVWQGQADFFYFKNVSGGLDVRFFGGNLDSDVMVLYQRYRINAKAHLPFENVDFFLSPILGFETTDLQTFREEWEHRDDVNTLPDSTEELHGCEKMFALDGFSLGTEIGFGVRVSRLFGFTGSSIFEHNFKGARLLSLTPGFAFNLREIWTWGKETLLSSWLSFELNFRRYFNRGISEWAYASFVGMQIGF